MKKLTLLILISAFSQTGFTGKRPDYGKIAVEGMVKGITHAFDGVPKATKIIGNNLNKANSKTKKWKKTVICNNEGKECKTNYSGFND